VLTCPDHCRLRPSSIWGPRVVAGKPQRKQQQRARGFCSPAPPKPLQWHYTFGEASAPIVPRVWLCTLRYTTLLAFLPPGLSVLYREFRLPPLFFNASPILWRLSSVHCPIIIIIIIGQSQVAPPSPAALPPPSLPLPPPIPPVPCLLPYASTLKRRRNRTETRTGPPTCPGSASILPTLHQWSPL